VVTIALSQSRNSLAYNFENGLQIVPGIGVPIGIGPSSGEKGIFLYLSFEHPFRKLPQNE